MPNIPIDIFVYTYKHKLGLCYLYINQSEDKKLIETLTIEGVGVDIIENEELGEVKNIQNNSIINIELLPKEERFIQIKANKINWSVKTGIALTVETI